MWISTHTLTWSVTIEEILIKLQNFISTHTLTWSVTVPSMIPKDDAENFNSHAHVERDTFLNPYYIYTIYFNSHAHVERDH